MSVFDQEEGQIIHTNITTTSTKQEGEINPTTLISSSNKQEGADKPSKTLFLLQKAGRAR